MSSFADKVAVITGCNKPEGIGFNIAERLKSNGWKVVAVCRKSHDCLKDYVVIDDIDATDDDCGSKLASKLGAIGCTKVDLLLNNAGLLVPGDLQKFQLDRPIGVTCDVNGIRDMYEGKI